MNYSNASRVCFYYANGLHVLRKEDINGSKCPIEGLIYADRIAEFDSLSRGGKEWTDFYRNWSWLLESYLYALFISSFIVAPGRKSNSTRIINRKKFDYVI